MQNHLPVMVLPVYTSFPLICLTTAQITFSSSSEKKKINNKKKKIIIIYRDIFYSSSTLPSYFLSHTPAKVHFHNGYKAACSEPVKQLNK